MEVEILRGSKRPMQMECEAAPSRKKTVPVRDTEGVADADVDVSSPASPRGGAYQVFLSFRGPDTRYGFTDFLYNSLRSAGVRVFQDDEELRKGTEIGPELDDAIRDSRISIPIFSERYAESKWCLRELELMLKCRSMGQVILPIFYHVTPKEVKHQPRGSTYEQAFNKLKESGISDEDIEQWKKALKEAGGLKGWELKKDASDRYEGKLIAEKIVPAVLLELKIKSMVVPGHLVGMDHHESEMKRLLDIARDDVQIVGIYGMSGIGKTTVAKSIYNKLLDKFDRCSFLADVQMTQTRQGTLLSLQKQLLSDTLNWSPDIITNIDHGKATIKEIFRNKKVLVVVDDVNTKPQFDDLVGVPCRFGKGSKIIVTTKTKEVLKDLEVKSTYELPVMNVVHSLQLFSMHAFGQEFPPKEFVSISRQIAFTSGGLPLALESLDLSKYDDDDGMRKDALEKFAEILDDGVFQKLSVDFEALQKEQQQIFLDIACLFAGMDKTTVFYMWGDNHKFPTIDFNKLCLRSLVKGGDAKLLMHNQLRALGKKIVDKDDPKCRSRLWNHAVAWDVLRKGKGTEKVEALSLVFDLKSEIKPCFRDEKFTELNDLRYLRVDGAELDGNFKDVLLSLRWLSWRGCPRDLKELNFDIRNLVILDLSKSGITEIWEVWYQIQMAENLKVLLVADCALTETPRFSSDAGLEILILAGCTNLKYIDKSIGNLKKLKVLDMSRTNIRELPQEIWMLEKLEVLDFTGCCKLEGDFTNNMERQSSLRFLSFYGSKIRSLPATISGHTKLQTLNIGGCTELQLQPELPSSLRILNVGDVPNLTRLVNLQELQLFGCHNLVEMPTDIEKLSKLKKLTLFRTKIRSLPEGLGLLSQLEVVDIQFCRDLICLFGLPSSLVELSLTFCNSLEMLPGVSNLKSLSSLLLKNCNKLAKVEGLGELESLTSLSIYACKMLATSGNMRDLSNLKKLETLSICSCTELDEIQGLDKLKWLKYLDLRDCEKLSKIEGLESLKSLEVLDVLRCASEIKIPEMPYTRIRLSKDEIKDGDSVQRYWTGLRDKKLEMLRRPPVLATGYRNEATQEELFALCNYGD